MKISKILMGFVLGIAAACSQVPAYANCGNTKNVGAGCSVQVPTGIVASTPVQVAPQQKVQVSVPVNVPVSSAANALSSSSSRSNSSSDSSARSSSNAQGGQGGSGGNVELNIQNQRVVSSAIAPSIFHSGGVDSCMGSTSGSVQGLSLGVSVGSTWTDKHCEALRASVRLNELGLKNTAMARLCLIPEIAEAFRISGEYKCPVKSSKEDNAYTMNN